MKSLLGVPQNAYFGVLFVLIWSSGYVVGALAAAVVSPLAVTLWRFVVAALVLGAIATRRREHWPRGRELMRTAIVGVPLFAIQFGALYTALAEGMPASTTALVACSSPLVVAMIGVAARWERLSAVNWLGIGLGVVGVAVTLSDRVARPPSLLALGWTLLGLAGLACGTVAHSRLRSTGGPTAVAAVEIGAAALVLSVWAPLSGSIGIPLTPRAVASLLWIAIGTGIGGTLLLFALIRRRGATGATSLLFVVPAVTALAGWPVFGQPVGLVTLLGLIIAAVALLLVRRRPGAAAASEADPASAAKTPRTTAERAAGRTGRHAPDKAAEPATGPAAGGRLGLLRRPRPASLRSARRAGPGRRFGTGGRTAASCKAKR